MSPRSYRFYIEDILDCIDKIQAYTSGMDYEQFAQDSKTIDAIVRNFIIIGEASRHIPAEISERDPSIPWRLMGDMRNLAVHEYWGVDTSVLWRAILNDLPPLIEPLSSLLKTIKQ